MIATASFTSGLISGAGNALLTQSKTPLKDILVGTGIGTLVGGLTSGLQYGIEANINDHTFWKGKPMYFDTNKGMDGYTIRVYDQKYASDRRIGRAAYRLAQEYGTSGNLPEVATYSVEDLLDGENYTAIVHPAGNTSTNSFNPIMSTNGTPQLLNGKYRVIDQTHYDFLTNGMGSPLDAKFCLNYNIKVTHINRYTGTSTIFLPTDANLQRYINANPNSYTNMNWFDRIWNTFQLK